MTARRTGSIPWRLPGSRVRYADVKGEREAELVRLAQAGDRGAKGTLVEAHDALVYDTVKRYFERGVDVEEIMQEGRLGLLRALETFDPSRGTTFATYAVAWIRHRAAYYLSEHCADIRVTPKVRAAFNRLLRRGGSLSDLDRSTSAADRMLRENVVALVPPVRLDAPRDGLRFRGEDHFGTALDKLPSKELLPDEELDRARTAAQLRDRVVEAVDSLPAPEREVILRRFPLDPHVEPESQVEIASDFRAARKPGPLTRQRIQQVEARAARLLRARLGGMSAA